MRIPRRVVFPGGWTVRVKMLSKEAYLQEGGGALACFDRDEKTIYLDRSRSKRQLRADFVHEADHAFVDWKDWFLSGGKTDD